MNESQSKRSVLLFGGAGFIGSNWAQRLLNFSDAQVHIFDNLSRPGSHHNLAWLKRQTRDNNRLRITIGDVRDRAAVERAVGSATEIYNFAAQVAVTSSVADPRLDFEVNLGGVFNILEAARKSGSCPFILFTSTNKVYGDLTEQRLSRRQTRYEFTSIAGIAEDQALDFHSPYGCSKGAADQYVRDYARVYGLPTVVFRMSCIAGPRQFGNEDQGWVSHFVYAALENRPLCIYGDGRQVRDVLHVADLLRAFEAARTYMRATAGKIYNVGGGPANATSLLELTERIKLLTDYRLQLEFRDFRPGDQLVYISDCSKIKGDTGWIPLVGLEETLVSIVKFWQHNQELFAATVVPIRARKAPATLAPLAHPA